MKVLLATDGSDHAKHAAGVLSRLPHRDRLDLRIVSSVVYPQLHPADATTTWPPEVWDQLRQVAESSLGEMEGMFEGAAATVETELLEGHAGHAIVEKAAAMDADLIVLGAKGHSAVSRLVLGSVSDHVATHATCGVLVVRPSPASESHPWTTTLAYDGSAQAERAIEQFIRFQWGRGTRTHALTIVPIVRFFGRDVLPEKLLHLQEQQEIASHLVERASECLAVTGTVIETHTLQAEHIGETIVDFASQQGSDLIVVGDTGLSGISRILLGSVSRYVLRHAESSVWIAR